MLRLLSLSPTSTSSSTRHSTSSAKTKCSTSRTCSMSRCKLAGSPGPSLAVRYSMQTAAKPHIVLAKMGQQDNPAAFLYQHTVGVGELTFQPAYSQTQPHCCTPSTGFWSQHSLHSKHPWLLTKPKMDQQHLTSKLLSLITLHHAPSDLRCIEKCLVKVMCAHRDICWCISLLNYNTPLSYPYFSISITEPLLCAVLYNSHKPPQGFTLLSYYTVWA